MESDRNCHADQRVDQNSRVPGVMRLRGTR
jgi:hypothetical protein